MIHKVRSSAAERRFELRVGKKTIQFGFTTRRHPAFIQSSAEFGDAFSKMECGAAAAYGIQVHSDRIAAAKSKTLRRFESTDALTAASPGLRLFVFTADCLPVFLIAPSAKPQVALVHAGWKGTALRIAPKAARKLSRQARVLPAKLIAYFGPALRSCCYEVGPEFLQKFPASTFKRGQALFFDLIAENRRQLLDAGVSSQNIIDSRLCTVCRNDLFYSYRKEKDKAGRILNWIQIDRQT